MAGHVVAMGGFDEELLRYAIGLCASERPRALFVPTAAADDPSLITSFYESAAARGVDPAHLRLFGVPNDPVGEIARADVVVVNGGNTANMLAIWRLHGVDTALRDAWQRGAVLTGWSAGANCWFESSVTDSFRADLDPLSDGLGLLDGSFCPHYDREERRRPVFEELVASGTLPAGLACDDGAALHFHGTKRVEAVASSPGSTAWMVTEAGSERLETRLVP